MDKHRENCERLAESLLELGFLLTADEQSENGRGKNLIQLRDGPFDLDLIFAPDGIETFKDAWARRVERHGFPIAPSPIGCAYPFASLALPRIDSPINSSRMKIIS